MTRLLLPLEHPTPAAEHDADDALLHALKRLPRAYSKYFCSTASISWTSPASLRALTCHWRLSSATWARRCRLAARAGMCWRAWPGNGMCACRARR